MVVKTPNRNKRELGLYVDKQAKGRIKSREN